MEVAAGAGAICTAGIARGSASAPVAPALSLISTLSGRTEVRSRSPCETILGRSIDTDTLERRVAPVLLPALPGASPADRIVT
ncbi:hypothetical protein [Nocardia sp. NPDC004123]